MADASYVIPSFLGGELSQFAQGRFDKPDYRISLKTCLNAFPVEIGPWARRPGTMHGGTTRGGLPARVIRFDFQQSAPVTLEFTDGKLRFRNGAVLIPTNDGVEVVEISTDNPAVMELASAVTWVTDDTLMFPDASTPLLENRQFLATKIDTTHFSLKDAVTGAPIDGSTLGAFSVAQCVRIHELSTSYVGGSWSNLRAVQAETTDILLCGTVAPQALTVTTLPSDLADAQFAIASAVFNDGPYLDPFTNGVLATPSAVSGIINLTLAFPAYSSTLAYAKGAFVTSVGVNYISLSDQNANNTPASSPTFWAVTSAGAAIGPNGFLGTDIGRLVRLFSEPPLWLIGSTYTAGTVVSYNPSGQPGATTYWQSLTGSNTGHAPGTDLTNWQIVPQAAIWTWGKITALSNLIDRALSGSVSLGDMTVNGGITAPFNGAFSQPSSVAAQKIAFGSISAPTNISLTSYVGKNYSGASAQKIQQATVYPSSDQGFSFGSLNSGSGTFLTFSPPIIMNLRASNTPPVSSSDGTLLGTTGQIPNGSAAVTIVSSDQTTTWNYVWIEITTLTLVGPPASFTTVTWGLATIIGQISFFNPPGTGTSGGVTLEILGPPLLYTNPITTWRLGVYSDTTGWPTCGVYNDGRLYLGGAVGNRFDASVSNGIVGGTINFAPTDQYGAVAASSAISYTFNSNGVNPILWMDPDLQGIKMGTQAGEWLVQAPTAGSIAPNNITARNVTNHGSANIQPCRTEHTTIFVQRFAKKLLEYFPDVFSGKFSAPNIADKAQHITRAGVAELAYTSAVTPIIWGRDALGALFGVTYKRDSLASAQPATFYGWHRHVLGSARVVESVCSGPSPGGDLDALTMVTNDPATDIRHVEVLTDTQDELSPLSAAWYLDNAVTPTSTTVSDTPIDGGPYGGLTINGLWHLNGTTVQVFAGGLDCGDPGEGNPISDFVVADGSAFVPFGDSISAGPGRGLFTSAFVATDPQIVVGFTYTSDGQVMRPMTPADSGARNGPAFAKISRGHRFGMKLVNTLGLFIGGDLTKKLYPAKFTKADGVTAIPALTAFSGIHQDALQDDYGYEGGAPAWRVTRPFPANVVAVGSNLSTQDQ